MGSAYHMKGAYATIQLFQEKLKKSGVADKVELSASFCMGECKDGPCVRIDGVKFHHVDQDRVASLVQEEIVPPRQRISGGQKHEHHSAEGSQLQKLL